jgi:hypothetical protein
VADKDGTRRRRELIGRLNSEEQPLSRGEIEERERQAISSASSQKQVLLFLATFSLITLSSAGVRAKNCASGYRGRLGFGVAPCWSTWRSDM